MTLLTREQILAADDRATVDVPVDKWGGTVRLLSLSGRNWRAIKRMIDQSADEMTLICHTLSLSIIGPEGKLVFTPEDVEALAEKDPNTLMDLGLAALRHNGINIDAGAEDDTDAMEKN